MNEVCAACDVDLCELCGHGCACPHVRPTSVLLAPLEQRELLAA